jgi:hypothetical protein
LCLLYPYRGKEGFLSINTSTFNLIQRGQQGGIFMRKDVKHLISLQDYSIDEITEIVKLGKMIYDSPEDYSEKCKGKILASLFYEPSTRTKFSFESAMLDLVEI